VPHRSHNNERLVAIPEEIQREGNLFERIRAGRYDDPRRARVDVSS
jgi:hypothetical protein